MLLAVCDDSVFRNAKIPIGERTEPYFVRSFSLPHELTSRFPKHFGKSGIKVGAHQERRATSRSKRIFDPLTRPPIKSGAASCAASMNSSKVSASMLRPGMSEEMTKYRCSTSSYPTLTVKLMSCSRFERRSRVSRRRYLSRRNNQHLSPRALGPWRSKKSESDTQLFEAVLGRSACGATEFRQTQGVSRPSAASLNEAENYRHKDSERPTFRNRRVHWQSRGRIKASSIHIR
jgi:hypothetical protein